MRDNTKLDAWFRLAVNSDGVPVKDTIPDQRFIFGCAERALELGKNPAAMFVKLVKERLENISNAQDDMAVARIKTLRGPPSPRTSDLDSEFDMESERKKAHEQLTEFKRRTRQREKSSGKKS